MNWPLAAGKPIMTQLLNGSSSTARLKANNGPIDFCSMTVVAEKHNQVWPNACGMYTHARRLQWNPVDFHMTINGIFKSAVSKSEL